VSDLPRKLIWEGEADWEKPEALDSSQFMSSPKKIFSDQPPTTSPTGNFTRPIPSKFELRPLFGGLVSPRKQCYPVGMSTLMEIESAVTALPTSEQQMLLKWLQSVVGSSVVKQPTTAARRDAWLRSMEQRRLRGTTSTAGTSIQQMMSDLRGD
jgi:hypothetical protein